MVNHINMDENTLKNIISDYKNRTNNELKIALSELSKDFEETKGLMIKLSHHLDGTEKIYNDILKEYKNRGNK
jgi:hypothetical protein